MPDPEATESWARFQRLFLDTLVEHDDAATIKEALDEADLSQEQRAWLELMRPDMLETAAALVKKWGERK